MYDSNEKTRQQIKEKTKTFDNVFVVKKLSKSIVEQVQVVVLSPAICMDNQYVKYALSQNKKVVSELELGYSKCRNDIIAITGTNGKTTTTSLVGHILDTNKTKNSLVGNIGVPITSKVAKQYRKDAFVCEVSSFQLEAITTFRPKIAAVLNIGIDHIDHHKTKTNYINAKRQITKNLKGHDKLIVNNNCKVSKKLANNTPCKKYYFDNNKKCFGCYQNSNNIYINLGKKDIFVMQTKDIKLKGQHNLDNVLCAVLCAYLYGVGPKVIARAVATFCALPHRLQTIATINGVEYISDSKATNIDSTLIATRAINKPTILILCGSDKGYRYDMLFENLPSSVTKIIGCGGVKQKLKEDAEKCNKQIVIFDNLSQATSYCTKVAKSGECVLLSPASASFDEFANYVDRGNKFEEYVRKFAYEK